MEMLNQDSNSLGCHLPSPVSLDTFNFRAGWGIRADSDLLNDLTVIPPREEGQSGRALVTTNRFGFDTTSRETSWVANEALESVQHGDVVLDIGAGYGALSLSALSKGATVVSNDLSLDHLLWTRSQATEEQRGRLLLNTSRFPELAIPSESTSIILAHRVVHFLSGEEIEHGLRNSMEWLKPGGMLGIVAISASHSAYRQGFLPSYLQRKDAGARWPGEWLPVQEFLPQQAYALPDRLHVFQPEDLSRRIEEIGFCIIRSDFVSMKKFGYESETRDGQEAVGILAVKPVE